MFGYINFKSFLNYESAGLAWCYGVGLAALTIVGIALYWWCWPIYLVDMGLYLVPWFEHIVQTGPIKVFGAPFSNYTPPYLYLMAMSTLLSKHFSAVYIIKALSVLISAGMASAFYALVRSANQPRGVAFVAALALLVVPSVIFNAALFGQCDAFWVAACLMVVATAIRNKPVQMLIWCGVAFAIKAQAVFIAPFAIGMLLRMRVKWWLCFVPAISFTACMAPALIMGWPARELVLVYFHQAQFFKVMSLNAPNFWFLLQEFSLTNYARDVPIALGLATLGALAVIWKTWRAQLCADDTIVLALLSALVLPYLLPMMHERYFMLADILAIGLFVVRRDRESLIVAIMVQLGSAAELLGSLSGLSCNIIQESGSMIPMKNLPGDTAMHLGGVLAMTFAVFMIASLAWNIPNRQRA